MSGPASASAQLSTKPLLGRSVAGFPPRRPGFDPRSCGICGAQSGTGAGFLRVLRLPCQFSFHQLPHTHLSFGTGTIGQLVPDVPSGLSLTPPQTNLTTKHQAMKAYDRVEVHLRGP
jgi:hypothetical protein